MYGFWDMKCDRIFWHSGPFFALLPQYELEKSKFWKNEKNTSRYHHFTCAPKIMIIPKIIMLYKVFLRYGKWGMQSVFLILDYFVLLYLPAEKNKIKKCLEISFYTYLPKIIITWCMVKVKSKNIFLIINLDTCMKVKIKEKSCLGDCV